MDWRRDQDNAEARKLQIQNGLVEVYAEVEGEGPAGENLLAYPIGHKYAQIASIPFFAEGLGLDDIVETEIFEDEPIQPPHTRRFRRIVKKNTDTFYVNFEASDDEVEKGEVLARYLLRHGLRSESFSAGVFAIAVPVYFDRQELEKIITESPYPLIIEDEGESQV